MSATALKSLQLLERIFSREAVAPPEPETLGMLWSGTSLSIAGVPLLVGEGELDEVIETPTITGIPGTKSWVLGVATHKGSLLPIFSGDAFFRKVPYAGRPRDYCIVIRRPGFHFGMTVSSIGRNIKFPIEKREMDCTVDPDFSQLTLGGFRHGEETLAVLDIDKLVSDSEFIDASVIESDLTEECEQ